MGKFRQWLRTGGAVLAHRRKVARARLRRSGRWLRRWWKGIDRAAETRYEDFKRGRSAIAAGHHGCLGCAEQCDALREPVTERILPGPVAGPNQGYRNPDGQLLPGGPRLDGWGRPWPGDVFHDHWNIFRQWDYRTQGHTVRDLVPGVSPFVDEGPLEVGPTQVEEREGAALQVAMGERSTPGDVPLTPEVVAEAEGPPVPPPVGPREMCRMVRAGMYGREVEGLPEILPADHFVGDCYVGPQAGRCLPCVWPGRVMGATAATVEAAAALGERHALTRHISETSPGDTRRNRRGYDPYLSGSAVVAYAVHRASSDWGYLFGRLGATRRWLSELWHGGGPKLHVILAEGKDVVDWSSEASRARPYPLGERVSWAMACQNAAVNGVGDPEAATQMYDSNRSLGWGEDLGELILRRTALGPVQRADSVGPPAAQTYAVWVELELHELPDWARVVAEQAGQGSCRICVGVAEQILREFCLMEANSRSGSLEEE